MAQGTTNKVNLSPPILFWDLMMSIFARLSKSEVIHGRVAMASIIGVALFYYLTQHLG